MRRRVALHAEHLEDRAQPTASVFGNPWPNADHLTFSFAPDGTQVAGYSQDKLSVDQTSALFAAMSGAGTPPAWEEEILRAFQTWAVNTNINIGLVPDAGSPFGPASAAPGNTPGGDIRVGAFATSTEVAAINQPYNVVTGAWAGTVLFNTNHAFSIGAVDGKYDVFSATLDEAGNIFGLADNNADTTSALYGYYIGVRGGLNASDVAAIQALYGGPRTPDAYEGAGGNDTPDTATPLTPVPSSADATKHLVAARNADLTTLSDVDYYTFTTRPDTTSLTVRLDAAGKSLLTAKVTVYDALGNVVATAADADPTQGQNLVLNIPSAAAGAAYTVRVEKGRDDVFGIGRYDLKVGFNFDPVNENPAAAAPDYVSDGGTNEDISTATPLSANDASSTRYAYDANLAGQTDVDFYRLTTPASTAQPMTVVLSPATAFGLYGKLTVYDAAGNVAPATVLANGPDGRYAVQLTSPAPSATYFVKVESVGRNGSGYAGNYELDVDFTQPALTTTGVATGALTDSQKSGYITVNVPVSRVFNFVLTAASSDPSVETGLRVIIYNPAGQPVATLTVDAGQTNSGTILLAAGTYYVKFEAATRTGAPLPTVTYSLNGLLVSDPIDPYAPPDPTDPPPPPPDLTTQDQGDLFYLSLLLADPWTDPWQW